MDGAARVVAETVITFLDFSVDLLKREWGWGAS